MRRPSMSPRDLYRWRRDRTLADLGGRTADWLEGRISSHPERPPGKGPDDETRELIEHLAHLNRHGYLTCSSQPGASRVGFDGAWWEERAAVEGYVDDPDLMDHLVGAADEEGLLTAINRTGTPLDADGIPVTTRNGITQTCFGRAKDTQQLRLESPRPGIHPTAFAAVQDAWQVTFADPEYGTGERLWDVLVSAAAARPAARHVTTRH
jgi:uncharacterized protein DUF6919